MKIFHHLAGITAILGFVQLAFPAKAEQPVVCEGDQPKLIRVTADFDGPIDGVIDRQSVFIYNSKQKITSISMDEAADGSVNYLESNLYDTSGLLLLSHRVDQDANNNFDEIYLTQYNEAGQKILETDDINADGNPDRSIRYEYQTSANGIVEKAFIDLNADGAIDLSRTSEYDADGRKIINLEDTNFDSIQDFGYFFEPYDSIKQAKETFKDFSLNPEITKICWSFWETDSSQITETVCDDWAIIGSPNSKIVRSYDAQGNVVKIASDFDGDENFDYLEKRTYDNIGNPIRIEVDNDGSGQNDSIEVFKNEYCTPVVTNPIPPPPVPTNPTPPASDPENPNPDQPDKPCLPDTASGAGGCNLGGTPSSFLGSIGTLLLSLAVFWIKRSIKINTYNKHSRLHL